MRKLSSNQELVASFSSLLKENSGGGGAKGKLMEEISFLEAHYPSFSAPLRVPLDMSSFKDVCDVPINRFSALLCAITGDLNMWVCIRLIDSLSLKTNSCPLYVSNSRNLGDCDLVLMYPPNVDAYLRVQRG